MCLHACLVLYCPCLVVCRFCCALAKFIFYMASHQLYYHYLLLCLVFFFFFFFFFLKGSLLCLFYKKILDIIFCITRKTRNPEKITLIWFFKHLEFNTLYLRTYWYFTGCKVFIFVSICKLALQMKLPKMTVLLCRLVFKLLPRKERVVLQL